MNDLKTDAQSGRLYFDIDSRDQTEEGKGEIVSSILEQDIGLKMLLYNRIQGMVSINCQHIDEMLRVYYETEGMQTLEQRFHDRTITVTSAKEILRSLLRVIESAEPYFIDKEKILLSEDSVFLDGTGNHVCLCYYPLETNSVYDGLKRVTEFLMKHIDHSDRKEIVVFYKLHNMIAEQSVDLEELGKHLTSQEVPQKKINETRERRHTLNGHKEHAAAQNTDFHCLVMKTERCKNRLEFLSVPKEIPLQGDIIKVGRRQQDDISLVPAQISREHAVIYCEGDSFQIEDKNSLNGTYINGRKISAYVKVPCCPGDIITFADIPYELV